MIMIRIETKIYDMKSCYEKSLTLIKPVNNDMIFEEYIIQFECHYTIVLDV